MAEQSENITLQVEGMTCSNCAMGITRTLKQKGLENVNVDFSTAEASFTLKEKERLPEIINVINNLGYKVIDKKETDTTKNTLSTIEKKFYFSLIFTVPLFSHMLLPFEFLHDAIV